MANSPQAKKRARQGKGGGSEVYDASSSANGRLRISETYNGSGLSASTRSLTVKVYFGSFNITKTDN